MILLFYHKTRNLAVYQIKKIKFSDKFSDKSEQNLW